MASRSAGRLWPLLLPAAYGLHLAEEWLGGFPGWASEHLAPGLTDQRFIVINAVAWPAMLVASIAAIRAPSLRWLIAGLSTILLVNGVLHLGSSAVTGTYAPGVITGTLIYIPLGGWALRRAAREAPAAKTRVGIALGLAAHAVVILVAFGGRP